MSKFKFLAVAFCGILAFGYSLNFGFAQDDFIFLYSSKASNLAEFLNFFNPTARYPDIFFFRPLSTQVFYFINTSLFGLNPTAFHIEGLILHIASSILFFLVVQKIWKNTGVSLISACLYSLSSIHFLSLFYIASFQEIAKNFFVLLSLFYIFKFFDEKRKVFFIISFLSFTAALLSKESSLIMPFTIPLFEMIRKNNLSFKSVLKYTLLPTCLLLSLSLIFAGFRIAGFRDVLSEGGYIITTNPWEVGQNLKWYLIWSFGLPEILSTYPSLKPSSIMQFMADFKVGPLIIFSFTIFLTTFLLKALKKLSFKLTTLSLLIFFIFLIPVLPLFQHRYPQYLDTSMLVMLPALAFVFIKKGIVVKISLVAFILVQIFSLVLTNATHWSTHRSIVASFYHKNLTQDYQNMQNETTIIFIGKEEAQKELSVTLAKEYALKVWFPGKIKNVFYEPTGTDKTGLPNSITIPIDLY